jgi:hypothetical protein
MVELPSAINKMVTLETYIVRAPEGIFLKEARHHLLAYRKVLA